MSSQAEELDPKLHHDHAKALQSRTGHAAAAMTQNDVAAGAGAHAQAQQQQQQQLPLLLLCAGSRASRGAQPHRCHVLAGRRTRTRSPLGAPCLCKTREFLHARPWIRYEFGYS
jgi:hypothetical protein